MGGSSLKVQQKGLATTDVQERSPHVEWAEAELRRAGLFDKDSDYEGMIGEEVLKLVQTFSEAGHSGYSAMLAAQIFGELSAWKPLTPLTDDPDEWMHIEESMVGNAITWQSRRNPSAFSSDGGKTYYLLTDRLSWPRKLLWRVTGKHRPPMHTSAPSDESERTS